ncbi:hypothetical protein FRC00_005181 [Tulasnella sp. 408]|nr:hypothetical protein FRC00_005181 [Tulasnella sp. 408]
MRLSSSVLTFVGLASSVQAWGGLGHKTVANVALQFLQADALAGVEAILAADGHKRSPNPSIVDVAVWADSFSHSPTGEFSKAYHYIDARDEPPFQCNVNLARDCAGPEECVVKAIGKYTQQLIRPSRNVNDTADALKFLIHFVGDITQPLHTEEKEKGGNGIRIRWKGQTGKKYNLHSAWDTHMVTELAGDDNDTNRDEWTSILVEEITNGSYKDLVPKWLSCSDINDALNCALEWAIDSNKLICEYVLKTDPAGKELSGSYFRGAAPIIDEQIAKGGVRLAVWLNQLFGSGVPGQLPTVENRFVIQDRSL